MHLNPVRAKMVAHPAEYRQSSYNAYVSRSDADILGRFKDDSLRWEEISHKRELKSTVGADGVIDAVTGYFGMSREELVVDRNGKRNITIYLMKKHTGVTNREEGRWFGGMSCSAVGKMYQRFRERLMEDGVLKKEVNRIEKRMSDVGGCPRYVRYVPFISLSQTFSY